MLELKREPKTPTEVRAKRFQEENWSGDSLTEITFVLKKLMRVKALKYQKIIIKVDVRYYDLFDCIFLLNYVRNQFRFNY